MIKPSVSRSLLAAGLCAALASLPLPSQALNILVTDDDGVTANIKAIQKALVAAGHDVIVSVPCQNQSGKGASINFLTPITPLSSACRGDAAPTGAPGVGLVDKATGLGDAYYVNGTPIMALLYGLDIVAPQRWKKAPDLVISGPNEGQNVGGIVITSGTVSNAQFALHRGVPAIAVSADISTTDNAALAAEAAALTVKLVDTLQHRPAEQGLLPAGVALNVNYPAFKAGESKKLSWAVTRFGNFDSYDVHFVSKLGDDPMAQHVLPAQALDFPGINVATKSAADATSATDPTSEALVNLQGKITVTPMQFGYEVPPAESRLLELYLNCALSEHNQKPH